MEALGSYGCTLSLTLTLAPLSPSHQVQSYDSEMFELKGHYNQKDRSPLGRALPPRRLWVKGAP